MKFLENIVYRWSPDSVRIIATPSVTARSTFFYVQETGHFKTLSNYYAERAHLNSYLVVYTLSGKGYLTYQGKSYTLTKNTVFFIDCMEYHYYETDKEDLWEIIWVHFNGATSKGYYEQFAKDSSPVITFKEDNPLLPILYKIIDIHREKSIFMEQLASKFIVDLLTEFLAACNPLHHTDGFVPEYVRDIMKYLDKRFNEKISLDQLAETHSIDKFYLAKQFKKYTGTSPNEYLINNRISYAKELLKYSSLPVSEIAENVGINNISHFIHLFKDRTDFTPLQFRKKWQKNK